MAGLNREDGASRDRAGNLSHLPRSGTIRGRDKPEKAGEQASRRAGGGQTGWFATAISSTIEKVGALAKATRDFSPACARVHEFLQFSDRASRSRARNRA